MGCFFVLLFSDYFRKWRLLSNEAFVQSYVLAAREVLYVPVV